MALRVTHLVLKDRIALEHFADVKVLFLKNTKGWRYVISLIIFGFQLILHSFRGFRTVFVFFGDCHSAVATFLRKFTNQKIFVRLGGFELNEIPEINYGGRLNPMRRICIEYSIKKADYLIPVAKDLAHRALIVRGRSEGIVHIPNGYDVLKYAWFPRKQDLTFLTVAHINHMQDFYLKGIDLLIDCAKSNPQYSFTLVGVNSNFTLTEQWPENLQIIHQCNHDEMIKYYYSHRFFFIPSRSEGMPNVLCEGILMGCVPIGAPAGDIPELIGNDQLVLKDWNISAFKTCVDYAITISESELKAFRDGFAVKYSMENRIDSLKELISRD